MEIQATSTNEQLFIRLSYPQNIHTTYNFKLTLKLQLQSIPSLQYQQIYQKIFYIPQKQIKIHPIENGKIYRITCYLSSAGNDQPPKSIFFFAKNNQQSNEILMEEQNQLAINERRNKKKQHILLDRQQNSIQKQQKFKQSKANEALCKSQHLLKLIGKSVNVDSKKMDRFILEARNCKNTKQFLNSKNQRLQNQTNRLIKKQQILLKTKMVFKQIYQQQQGTTFFKNDWFMGPFYSYDNNESKMVKK